MEYFKSFSQSHLVKTIEAAQKDLFLCMPSLHKELSAAIIKLNNSSSSESSPIDIHLLIDFDAQTFRQGYGDYHSVEQLLYNHIDIKNLKDNRISFIISDSIGYYLFIESRSLIPADKETINAIKIDPVSIVRLKKFFFNDVGKTNFENELANAIIEEGQQLNNPDELLSNYIAPVSELSEAEIKIVSTDLKNNPPLHPDYKRIVEIYSNKFQYVRLKFEGANLSNKKIEIPAKALPFTDVNLKKRMEAKLNLFDSATTDATFQPLLKIKEDEKSIRKNYLTKVKSREESLLDKLLKNDFESELHNLRQKMCSLKNSILSGVAAQINKTKDILLAELSEFFIENPKTLFPDHPHLWEGDKVYIQQAAKTNAERIIHKIKWPEAHTLVDGFTLEVKYSDITFEDLKNEQFIKELLECGLIDADDKSQLSEFSKGIKAS